MSGGGSGKNRDDVRTEEGHEELIRIEKSFASFFSIMQYEYVIFEHVYLRKRIIIYTKSLIID